MGEFGHGPYLLPFVLTEQKCQRGSKGSNTNVVFGLIWACDRVRVSTQRGHSRAQRPRDERAIVRSRRLRPLRRRLLFKPPDGCGMPLFDLPGEDGWRNRPGRDEWGR